MTPIIIIAVVVILVAFLIWKHTKNKTKPSNDPIQELNTIQNTLYKYKVKCIDGNEITEETATPLDNIAYFMTTVYPKLSDNLKTHCNHALFVYSDKLMELLNQILKEPENNDPKETDEWYKSRNQGMAALYQLLINATYPTEIEKHKDEYIQLSAHKYMEIQKQIEIWALEEDYTTNETVTKGAS